MSQAVQPMTLPRRVLLGQQLRRLPWPTLIIMGGFVFISLLAPVLSSHSPYEPALSNRLRPPMWEAGGSADFFLGTDTLGRDVVTRLFYGARASLMVALLSMVVAGLIGTALGIVSGYIGGRTDALIMRVVDASLALPNILIALLLAATLGAGIKSVTFAIVLVLWARIARVVRGEALSIKERDFVALARISGCSHLRVMLVHIFPNLVNTLMVLLSLNLGQVIIFEASLSFLGAGIPPPNPSWGQMVAEGRSYIDTAWWLSIIPGLAIVLVVLAFNRFGDWLRDYLDPKLRQV